MVVGTPHYFAPEQARGRSLDGRADLYSLGVTLYRAASGVLPFPGEDWYAVARAHVEEEPADVRSHGAPISIEMAAIIHRLLEKDPKDRFQDAEELHAALALAPERGEPSTSTMRTVSVPALDRLWTTTGITVRRRRLRRRVLWAAGGAVALASALALFSVLRSPPSDADVGTQLSPPGVVGLDSVGPGDSGLVGENAPLTLPALTVLAPPTIADSVPEVVALPPTLHISAPDGATLTVDGRRVGDGSWTSSKLTAGSHRVAAEVATVPGCESARDEKRVTLVAGRTDRVQLAPRPCGTLTILPQVGGKPLPADAGGRYTLVDASGASRSGRLPVSSPVVLPAGRYDLRVDNVSLCTQFSGMVEVIAGSTVSPRIVLLCER